MVPKLSDILSELHTYDRLAFRIALRRDQSNESRGWRFHTLIIDAIPASYLHDEVSLKERYRLERFVHLYPTAAFIAGMQESSAVLSWFNTDRQFSIPAPNGPGTSTRVVTTQMITVQEQPWVSQQYYRTRQNDGFDRMLWPHNIYSFPSTTPRTEPYDNTPLIPTPGTGSRYYHDFNTALIELIYGITDRFQAQGHDNSPKVVVRIVKEAPFLADIKQVDHRHLSVAVHGINMAGAVLQLDLPGAPVIEKLLSAPESYQFELDTGVPRSGRLILIQGNELSDRYEWEDATPLPGAPPSTGITTSIVYSPGAPEYLGQTGTTWNLGGLVPGGYVSDPADMPEDPDENVPVALRASLAKFRTDHPDCQKTGFIMMRFRDTQAHNAIHQTIKKVLAAHGLTGVRADDKEYHDNTYENIQTYMHGCGFGIAVFERLITDDFNPNVALEVGYMQALEKPICLLKDSTLAVLQTDIIGKLYRPFDAQHSSKSVKAALEKWLHDQDLI